MKAEFTVSKAQAIAQDDGTVTFPHPDGGVVSVQPNGDIETRPDGTAGEYEKATIESNKAVFRPQGKPWAILLVD